MDTTYHVASPNGTTFGQMTQDEIIAKSASGELPADALIWAEGMADWQPASTLCPPPVNAAPWGIMSALKSVYFSRYFDFRGRACRSEYWYAYLGTILFTLQYSLVGGFLAALLFRGKGADVMGAVLLFLPLILFALYSIIPGLAVMVRRLHDIGMSGWFYLINFVPYVGPLFLLVCAVLPSSAPNRWGTGPEDPVR